MTPWAEEDWTGFRAWLSTQYSAATVKRAVRDARKYANNPSCIEDVPSFKRATQFWDAWEYMGMYHRLGGGPPLPDVPKMTKPKDKRREGVPDGRRPKAVRKAKSTKLPIPPAQFVLLRAAIRRDSSYQAAVLDVLSHTSLRIGDVLRTPRTVLEDAFHRDDRMAKIVVKGDKTLWVGLSSAERSWERLHTQMWSRRARNAAAAACTHMSEDWSGDGPAYAACKARLATLAEACGILGKTTPHRLRRTVGDMIADRFGKDAAQELLGHEDSKTTDIYAREGAARFEARATVERMKQMNDELDADVELAEGNDNGDDEG